MQGKEKVKPWYFEEAKLLFKRPLKANAVARIFNGVTFMKALNGNPGESWELRTDNCLGVISFGYTSIY